MEGLASFVHEPIAARRGDRSPLTEMSTPAPAWWPRPWPADDGTIVFEEPGDGEEDVWANELDGQECASGWSYGVGRLDLLRIEANAQLASLDGLDGLETVANTFRIRENPTLPQCEAEALLAEMQAAGFEGSTTVELNDENAMCE